uniref:Predicted protein n=1 Tax=Hordeum vulgare subsp. vulgare TaxID=112509 RepID=F2EL13_HORVV|nr:predicted protein [Hordeum vulgare subsp. vulgare]
MNPLSPPARPPLPLLCPLSESSSLSFLCSGRCGRPLRASAGGRR